MFGDITGRQNMLEKTIRLRKGEGRRKRGGPNVKWTGSIKEATTLRTAHGLLKLGHSEGHTFTGLPLVNKDLMAPDNRHLP